MRSKCILMIVFLVLIGCEKAEGGGTTTPSNIHNRVITPETEKVTRTAGSYQDYIIPVEINLDDLTFEEAFRIEHNAKGKNHTFWWHGKQYTTNLFTDIPVGDYEWVRNNNDADDSCQSNIIDECGVCDGNGMDIWYMDLDRDGLGDPNVYTKACTYPSVDDKE